MFKVALVADIHIRVDELPIGLSWNNRRLQELSEYLNTLDVDFIWILGDLFDRSKPTMGDIIAAKEFLEKIDIPIQYLNGNHERISKDLYTLNLMKSTLKLLSFKSRFEVEGVSFTAVDHNDIQKISELPPSDILLSHFRWSHSVFGAGELNKTSEKYIKDNFKLSILGDIHYPYEPEENVKYISSPYSINFSSGHDYGIGILKVKNGEFNFERIKLDLPCKISAKVPFNLLSGFIESTNEKHLYKVVVDLDYQLLDSFKKFNPPDNVLLVPKFADIKGKEEVKKIEVGANIKDVLLDSLHLPSKKDKEYIKNVLKED